MFLTVDLDLQILHMHHEYLGTMTFIIYNFIILILHIKLMYILIENY